MGAEGKIAEEKNFTTRMNDQNEEHQDRGTREAQVQKRRGELENNRIGRGYKKQLWR
jgi:hypothetical protein